MKTVIKILKIVALLVIISLVTLFSASRLLQEKVADIVINKLNQNIKTRITAGSSDLSFLSKFPRASLELKDVLIASSPDCSKEDFREMNTDTLLTAGNVSVEFSITDIIRGNYTIEQIRVRTGKVNLFTDSAGKVNYNITRPAGKREDNDFTLNLEKVYLTDMRFLYYDLASNLFINGTVSKGNFRSRFHNENIVLNAEGKVKIERFKMQTFSISRDILADIDLNLEKTVQGIRFKKGSLKFDDYSFILQGSVRADDFYDLKISGHNINISKINNYLPEKLAVAASDYDPSGELTIDCTIKGRMTRTSNPHAEINFSLDKGKIRNRKSDLSLNNISLRGIYSNGPENRYSSGLIKITDFKAKLGSAGFSGSGSVNGFTDPYTELGLKGTFVPEEAAKFFGLDIISESSGSVIFDLKLAGRTEFRKTYTFSDLVNLNPRGTLEFRSFSLGIRDNSFLVSGLNGTVTLSDITTAKNLRFIYKGQKISVDGEFTSLLKWLDDRPVRMTAKASVKFDKLNPELFTSGPSSAGNKTAGKRAFRLPENVVLDINFNIDSLTYKTFSSSGITGKLNYNPRLLTFKSFNMKALKGSISGNGFILQNSNRSVMSKGIFNVNNVDVNQAFRSFRNFGQNFLKAENIEGSLSGSFSLLLPLDSLLNPQIKSLTAEGKYRLTNGALINFDPVKELSSYIELSELENIHFEKMENDFFIRNNYLYIPTMEVRSSAVDLSVNGKHSFDNDYEYHVKVLLSEILSKKRKRQVKNVTEFGEVQDDGLGRTSMLLKIIYKGEEVKVSYDMKAAANEVRNNFRSERKNLKSIMNQEYGWFDKDTTLTKEQQGKKSKVKVTWDDK